MQYRQNVACMAAELGLVNPLREEDLHLEGVTFEFGEHSRSRTRYVPGTDMNRGARCYIEQIASGFKGSRPAELKWDAIDQSRAAGFFAEIWADRVEKDRAMLIGLGKATKIKLHWKASSGRRHKHVAEGLVF